MNFLVSIEVRLSAEGFPTFTALMRSLSSVDFFMSDEVTPLAKGFPTFIALIKLICTVNLLVLNQKQTTD